MSDDEMREKIDKVNELLSSSSKPMRGTWTVEEDEDGEIAVFRDNTDNPIAFMNAGTFRDLKARGKL